MTAKHTELTDTRCQLHFADGRRCGLPAHPQGNGLCYRHAHAPHRRLRPSDLTRELITPRGTVVPAHKIRRVLAKLPVAVADGLFSPPEAGLLTHLCNLMLGCTREARTNSFLESIPGDRHIFTASAKKKPEQTTTANLVENADPNPNQNDAQPTSLPASS